jgi:hypothetical protein
MVAKHIQWKLLVLVEGFAEHFWLVNQILLLGDVFLELLLRFLVVFVCCTRVVQYEEFKLRLCAASS